MQLIILRLFALYCCLKVSSTSTAEPLMKLPDEPQSRIPRSALQGKLIKCC